MASHSFQRRTLPMVLSLFLLSSCGPRDEDRPSEQTGRGLEDVPMSLQLSSPAFPHGEAIPAKYTADGADVSPPLQWSDPPAETRSFVLICDDPDAPRGTWVHWLIWNIPADARRLPEGIPTKRELPDGARQGTNDFGRIGYGGPAPPPGKPHRYFFRLYALDTVLDVPAGARRPELEQAMQGHVLARGELMGTYGR